MRWIAVWATILLAAIAPARAQDAALVKAGEYVARLGDCAACHTAPGGRPLAGGLKMATPIGAIYSSNITPDREHGIGAWSFAQFDRLMRRGIGPHGEGIYPAMPYPSYARMSDADMHALYAWLMQGVAPVAQADRHSDIVWPLSMRWPLRIWAWMFAREPTQAASSRGAYLVEGLGHCGACHTKRRLTLQEAATSAQDGTAFLAGGGVIDGWEAINLRGDDRDGLGRWSEDDIVAFLRHARDRRRAEQPHDPLAGDRGAAPRQRQQQHRAAQQLQSAAQPRIVQRPRLARMAIGSGGEQPEADEAQDDRIKHGQAPKSGGCGWGRGAKAVR